MPRRRRPDQPAEGDDPRTKPGDRRPTSPGEIATAAFGLAVLQAHTEAVGGVAAADAAVYETLALLTLEALAMLAGRDPAGFEHLLNGLGIYARMRSVECMHAAMAGQPPTPLGQIFAAPVNVH